MLLRTRFYIPPYKPEHVLRRPLLASLQQSSGGELVLISAPAGYGKTSLVSQWLHTHSLNFAWLIIDRQQAVAEVFWQYVITALQTLLPNMGEQALILLTQQEIEAAVISLLNDLDRLDVTQESNHAYTLVMDDFHKAQSSQILSSLNLFLDHLPPCLRVVMTVRHDPALELARRRANGQLIEIQQHDLAFSSDECHAFLSHKLNKEIPLSLAQHVTQATEGWVTGIQLSSMSADVTLAAASEHDKHLNRNMADYLFEEVFSQQPSSVQTFLLTTALVDKFCPALSNQLCHIDNSYQIIKHIDDNNLFIIALDNHRTWYRYHDLFRQFLLLHHPSLKHEERQDVHRLAMCWLNDAGHYELAFQQAVIIKDWRQCQVLFDSIAEEKISQGLQHVLMNLVQDLPAELAATLIEKFPSAAPKVLSHAASKTANTLKLEEKSRLETGAQLAEPLTQRESQVMALVQQGLSNKDIADALFISLNTLKVHIRNVYGKMGVENRTQALLKVMNSHQ